MQMNWYNCYSDRRTGVRGSKEVLRTEYQRDFDRLIFASSFRRLQDKTQVFPLPGSTFVHNRLTHSLEVASVGRSIGKIVGNAIAASEIEKTDTDTIEFYKNDLSSVIAAACLAHDIGNPAFGHSGEKAISNYFIAHAEDKIEHAELKSFFSSDEWEDLINFEGNANAFRILTHQFKGKLSGGMRLTYATIAAILKYPCPSHVVDKSFAHTKKYGFFQADKVQFDEVCESLHMLPDSAHGSTCYFRHPFVYMVEAADDICYRIIDMEDAHRLGILTKDVVASAFLNIIKSIDRKEDNAKRIEKIFLQINDANEAITYLRAKAINTLILESSDIFMKNKEDILAGNFAGSLIDNIEKNCGALKEVINISVDKIYSHPSVIEIEIAGFYVMSHLLNLFIPAVLKDAPANIDKMSLKLIPEQFLDIDTNDTPYLKVLSVLDFISGMTDNYASELYRKTTGIEISKHR